ncbi:MAG: peptidylprolyl isomerase [Candidatus Altiarchaeales archaeon]|nr:peptidylprolyl isomerase [Candidatus Altiarchaeales archaeon]
MVGLEMDFIKISYTGKIKDGQVFDTTSDEVAKKEDIHDPQRIYKPLAVVVGERQVIEGLDEALAEMKVGDQREVEIPPEKAYGKRDPAQVRLVPLKVFKKQNMTPVPGMPVELDGQRARIQTVSGGRVRVDFNHELADKTLIFDVKVEEKADSDKKKAEFLVEKSFNSLEDFIVDYSKKTLKVSIPQKAYQDRNLLVRKASLAAEAYKYLGADEVVFEEVWRNPEKKDAENKKDSKGKNN